jgi:hypothetical protein
MYYATPPASPDVLAVARRASLLMFILGGLTLIVSTCVLATIIGLPAGELAEQMQKSAASTGQTMPFDADQLKVIFIGFLAVGVMVAIALIGLGVGVRRGGKVTTIISIVLTALMLGFLVLQIVHGLLFGAQSPTVLAGVCVMSVPFAIMAVLIVWLFGAMRAISRAGASQQHYAAQYWQYQKNMQAYAAYAQHQQQLGYPTPGNLPQGYATAPPAPPITPTPADTVGPTDGKPPQSGGLTD